MRSCANALLVVATFSVVACGDGSGGGSGGHGASDGAGGGTGDAVAVGVGPGPVSVSTASTSVTLQSASASGGSGGEGAGGDGSGGRTTTGEGAGVPAFCEEVPASHCADETTYCHFGESTLCDAASEGSICRDVAEISPYGELDFRCIQPEAGGACGTLETACGPELSCGLHADGSPPTCEAAPYMCDEHQQDRCLPDGRRATCHTDRFWPSVGPCPEGKTCFEHQAPGEGFRLVACFEELPRDVGPDCDDCIRYTLNPPAWEPIAAVVVPAPYDSNDREPYRAWLASIVGDDHVVSADGDLLLPGSAHAGHGTEIAERLATAGVAPRQTYTGAEFANPYGVAVFITIVPTADAPIGATADGVGPMIPFDELSIVAFANLIRGYERYDFSNMDRSFRAEDYAAEGYDGVSHLIFVAAENSDFVPGSEPEGDYDLAVELSNGAAGNYQLFIPFQVMR